MSETKCKASSSRISDDARLHTVLSAVIVGQDSLFDYGMAQHQWLSKHDKPMKDLVVNGKLTYKKAEVLKTLHKISDKFFKNKNREDARNQWVDDMTKILMDMFRGLSQGVCKERSWAYELEAGKALWGTRRLPEKKLKTVSVAGSRASIDDEQDDEQQDDEELQDAEEEDREEEEEEQHEEHEEENENVEQSDSDIEVGTNSEPAKATPVTNSEPAKATPETCHFDREKLKAYIDVTVNRRQRRDYGEISILEKGGRSIVQAKFVGDRVLPVDISIEEYHALTEKKDDAVKPYAVTSATGERVSVHMTKTKTGPAAILRIQGQQKFQLLAKLFHDDVEEAFNYMKSVADAYAEGKHDLDFLKDKAVKHIQLKYGKKKHTHGEQEEPPPTKKAKSPPKEIAAEASERTTGGEQEEPATKKAKSSPKEKAGRARAAKTADRDLPPTAAKTSAAAKASTERPKDKKAAKAADPFLAIPESRIDMFMNSVDAFHEDHGH